MASTLPSPTLGDLFWNFCRVAARGFGGAMPWARRMLVEERAWLTPQEFMDVLSLCQLLPGPNVINLSVVVGSHFRGVPGALAAALGLLVLPFVVVLVLGVLYTRFGQVPAVEALLRGVGPAAAGLIIATGLKMAAPMARAPRALGFLLAVFAGVALLRWPLVPVLLGIAPLSVLVAWARRR
jgi:chromate transporter